MTDDRSLIPDFGKSWSELLDFDRDAVSAHDHGALGHREVVGEDHHLVILGGVELDDGAATEPQHLMDRHAGGAEDHLDIEGNLVERGHVVVSLPKADGTFPSHHAMVTGWLTRATISWPG